LRADLVSPPVKESLNVIAYFLPDLDDVLIVQFTISPSVEDMIPDTFQREPCEFAVEFDVDPYLFG
jgi:hypothetical protein